MPDLSTLAPQELPGGTSPNRQLPGVVRGVVASTPAGSDESILVRVPSRDPDGRGWLYGPAPWTPRIVDESTYAFPSEGDLALVVFDEDDEPWVVEWWPYEL